MLYNKQLNDLSRKERQDFGSLQMVFSHPTSPRTPPRVFSKFQRQPDQKNLLGSSSWAQKSVCSLSWSNYQSLQKLSTCVLCKNQCFNLDFRFWRVSLWILSPPPVAWRFCASVSTFLNVNFSSQEKQHPHQTHRAIGRLMLVDHKNLARARKGDYLERHGAFCSFLFLSKMNSPWEGKIKVAVSPLG